MRTIWKFEINVADVAVVRAPEGACFLRAVHAVDPTTLWLWAEVDADRPLVEYRFRVVGTGNPVHYGEHLYHLGSAVAPPFVWHVYEARP